MDLLMAWDWDATAEIMAEDDPSMAEDPYGYEEFSPEPAGDGAEQPSTEAKPEG